MDLDAIGGVARLVNYYASLSAFENAKLEADPTGYFSDKIKLAGLEVPEGFHVHIVAKDGDIPIEDPSIETVDRTVFTLNSKNEVSRADIPAGEKASDVIRVGSHGNCNGCKGVCIVKSQAIFV